MRLAAEVKRLSTRTVAWLRNGRRASRIRVTWAPDDGEVAAAWAELREHPALSWVPPMWRSMSPTTDPERHAVSALERNLLVEVVPGHGKGLQVRLKTGPLTDRRVGDGVDPTTPSVSYDPALTVLAPTFEIAVIELRNAVLNAYGAPGHRPRFLPPAEARKRGPSPRLKSVR
jgi:hypothetical protein